MSPLRSKERIVVAAVMALWLGGCSKQQQDLTGPTAAAPTTTQGIVVDPNELDFDFPGEQALVQVRYKGQTGVAFTQQVANPAIAGASWQGFNTNSTFAVLDVTAMGAGSTTIQFGIEGTAERASMSVVVETDFTRTIGVFKGEVAKEATPLTAGPIRIASCPGGAKYTETVTVALGKTGTGTLLVQDTPGFDRKYSVSGASGTSFVSHGSFPFVGLDVPGDLAVTFTDAHTMKFRETTTYGTGASACANTFAGTLTRP